MIKALFETDSIQKNIFASNEKFLGFYKPLFFDRIEKPKFSYINPTESNAMKFGNFVRSLKLLDGKWGNFFFSPEKNFFVLSSSAAVIDYEGFTSSLYIYSFEKHKKFGWRTLTSRVTVFENHNHEKDEAEEQKASSFARNCIRKLSLFNDPVSSIVYLNKVRKQLH